MIYFIQAEDKGIKIGITANDPEIRLQAMQSSCPLKLTFFGVIEGDSKEEEQLHKRFEGYKIRGEWYSITIKKEIEEIIQDEISLLNKDELYVINNRKDLDNINKPKDLFQINVI